MATSFKLEHDFENVSLKTFESYLNHPKLNSMLVKNLSFDERKLVDKKETGKETTWQFEVTASGDMPSAVQKILKASTISYLEISKFVPKEHCIYWQIKPISPKIKFEGSGVWRLLKHNNGVKRIIEGEVKVDIPFVGRMIEKFIVDKLKKDYEIEPDIQREFFAHIDE